MCSEFPIQLIHYRESYEKSKSAFCSSHKDWNQNRVLAMEFACQVMSSFREILMWIVTIAGANGTKSNSSNIFGILFLTLTYMVPRVHHSMQTTCSLVSLPRRPNLGPYQKNVVDCFKIKKDWVLYLENLQLDQLCWKPSWLHVGKVIIHGVGNSPLLL